MIPRIQTGTSFKGAGLYYLHDKQAETKERVAWTYAANTLHDEPQAVIREMQQTYYDQEMLKQISGNRADGRPTKTSVMTIALAWSPEQNPDKQHMIETGHSYLQAMGWEGHQALFVAHNDTKHPHMHIVLNRIHPETGMVLDDSFSKTRAQKWALGYERENGKIYCQEREQKHGREKEAERGQTFDKEKAINAPVLNYREWQTWEQIRREGRTDPEFQKALAKGEWDALKQSQRDERDAFWKETGELGKKLRDQVWESVKGEFAPEWKAYKEKQAELEKSFKAQRREDTKKARFYIRQGQPQGAIDLIVARDYRRMDMKDQLFAMRKDIAQRQKERAKELGGPALDQFHDDRRDAYELLKASHRDQKAELRHDQQAGIRRPDLLDAYSRPTANENQNPFAPPRTAANDSREPSRVSAEMGKPAFDLKAWQDLQRYVDHARRVTDHEKAFEQTKDNVAAKGGAERHDAPPQDQQQRRRVEFPLPSWHAKTPDQERADAERRVRDRNTTPADEKHKQPEKEATPHRDNAPEVKESALERFRRQSREHFEARNRENSDGRNADQSRENSENRGRDRGGGGRER